MDMQLTSWGAEMNEKYLAPVGECLEDEDDKALLYETRHAKKHRNVHLFVKTGNALFNIGTFRRNRSGIMAYLPMYVQPRHDLNHE